MSSATASNQPKPIVRLWKDIARGRQNDAIERLHYLQASECERAAKSVHEQALEQARALAEEVERRTGAPSGRIDVPSWRAFAAVLGLFRTCYSLKKAPIRAIELSREDIARHTGLGRQTVANVLRWLDAHPVEHRGVKLNRNPIGWLHRARRYGKAILNTASGPQERAVNRTNRTVLTEVGKIALGLLTKAQAAAARVRSAVSKARRERPRVENPRSIEASPQRRTQDRASGDDDGGGDVLAFPNRPNTQRETDFHAWAQAILERHTDDD